MSLLSVQPGVKLYQDEKASVMFGCPPEIIKDLMVQKIGFPDTIVIPDTLFRSGVLQNCTEFPLYYFLFVLGNYSKGNRLTLVGEKEVLDANRELLRLTLLGPTKEEYDSIGPSPYFETLYRESRYLSVKDKSGKEIPIDGFIDFLPFAKGEARNERYSIRHLDRDLYSIGGTEVALREPGSQNPVYDLKTDYAPKIPHKFGVDILGGGSGFTPGKPSSAVLLNYNSDYMLIDCPPYLDHHLRARGIAREQLKSIFLTHIHDDHCNVFPLVEFNTKLKFLGTPEVYWMTLKKLSLQTMHRMDEFRSYFEFIELEPYKENDFYGIKIIPHYTVHSIPTIGATFTMNEKGKKHSIGFGGDNKSLPQIRQMTERGITPKDKLDHILQLYHDRYDLLMVDGGMGLLHGDPEDAMASKSDRVVFMHLEKLPEKFDATFSMALPGKRYILSESKNDAYLIKAMEIFHQDFPGISQEWITALMNNLDIVQLNSGDIIIKQGDSRKGNIFLILSGSCGVLFHDGQKLHEIAVKEAGDFIGEMAVIKREKSRSASVVAKTPVILGLIDEEIYYAFLESEKRIDAITRMWEIRKAIEALYPFSEFSDLVNERLARAGTMKDIAEGTVVVAEGESAKGLYIVLSGLFEERRDGHAIGDLGPGSFFGEVATISDRPRDAAVVAMTKGSVLVLGAADVAAILDKTPSLQFAITQMARK
jgi:CRP-like cAMP-binding protein